jgi:hypothetical protein
MKMMMMMGWGKLVRENEVRKREKEKKRLENGKNGRGLISRKKREMGANVAGGRSIKCSN